MRYIQPKSKRQIRYDAELPEYSLGGNVLAGAASGAAAGSVIPGWGTLAGGVIGAASGLISGLGEKKAEGEAEEMERQNAVRQERMSGLEDSPNYLSVYAKDGALVPGNNVKADPSLTGVSKRIYETVGPRGYSVDPEVLLSKARSFAKGTPRTSEGDYREELWARGLGSTQPMSKFSKSQFTPTRSTDPNAEYLSLKGVSKQDFLCDTLSQFEQDRLRAEDVATISKKWTGTEPMGLEDYSPDFGDTKSPAKSRMVQTDLPLKGINTGLRKSTIQERKEKGLAALPSGVFKKTDALGNYTVFKGEDKKGKYVGYYDKWDFANPLANKATSPTELYDRMYYKDNPNYRRFSAENPNKHTIYNPYVEKYALGGKVGLENNNTMRRQKLGNSKSNFNYPKTSRAFNGDFSNIEGQVPLMWGFTYPKEGRGNPMTVSNHMYAMGGLQPEGMPVEVESGESINLPNGGAMNVPEGAPTHAQGGVQETLPGGTEILSDRLKVPGTKETFADANKKLISGIEKATKILKDPHSTRTAKRTAEKNINNLEAKKDKLFSMQQQMNGNYQGGAQRGQMQPPNMMGGMQNPQMQQRGLNRPQMASQEPSMQQGQPPMAQTGMQVPGEQYGWGMYGEDRPGTYLPNYQDTASKAAAYKASLATNPQAFTGPLTGTQSGSTQQLNQPGAQIGEGAEFDKMLNEAANANVGGGDWKSKVGGYASSAATLAPMLYNIGEGLFGKREQLDPARFSNIAGMKAASNMRNREFNIEPQLEAGRSAYGKGVRNLAARSRGEQLGGMTTMASAAAANRASLYSQKQNIENQYGAQADQMMAQVGAQDAQSAFRTADWNARSRTAGSNLIGQGLAGLSQYAQQGTLDRNRNKALVLQIESLKKTNPNADIDDLYSMAMNMLNNKNKGGRN